MNLNIVAKNPSESVSDYAYRILHRNITQVNLKPGECVSPVEVAAALDVSRTPIHGAFARLTADGLLNVYPQRGSYVSMIDFERAYESIYMRNLLDQAAMRLLCAKGVDEQGMSRLETNLHWQKFYYEKYMLPEVFDLDTEFHGIMYDLVGMRNMHNAVKTISPDQHRIRFLKLNSRIRWEQTVDEHDSLLDAMRNRDAEKGCYLSYLHIARFAVDIQSVYDENPDYFTNWEKFHPDYFSHRVDNFYNLLAI